MTIDWRSFKRDRFFFLKYFAGQMLGSVLLLAILHRLLGAPDDTLQLTPWHLLALPVMVALGIKLPAMLHNAVHNNLKPRWLNDVIGEAIGFFVLFGLGPFRISHFLHHGFADSERDPHPPAGKGFLHFMAMTQLNTIRVIRREFLDSHGETWQMHAVLIIEMAFYYVSLLARIACWYWLLGATGIVAFYLPAYVTNVLVFAHINFATHKTLPDGSTEIVNLDHNAWYRLVNRIGDGVYFHRNHHLKPTLGNPAKLQAAKINSIVSSERKSRLIS